MNFKDLFNLLFEATDTVPAELMDVYNWHGSRPPWKGLAIEQNSILNLNNAGPMVLTIAWVRDYNRMPSQVKDEVKRRYARLIQNKMVNVERKKRGGGAQGGLAPVLSLQMGHDTYNIFDIEGPERRVVWKRLFDDHDVYIKWLSNNIG
jgi:hypothetical protein